MMTQSETGAPSQTYARRVPGSFRDPSGYVYETKDSIWRSINSGALEAFEELRNRGVYRKLFETGHLIDFELINPDHFPGGLPKGPRGESAACIVRHPRAPFFSYPYEWTFSQLKDAALAHLDLQVAALDLGAALSDATPYNMQFFEGRMLHVDVLSMKPYREGELWAGYNQFCRLFLFPLLIESWKGVAFQPLLRGALNGIKIGDAARILPVRKLWLSLNGLLHVTLHARQERRYSTDRQGRAPPTRAMPKPNYRALLTELRSWINGLQSTRRRTFWRDYAKECRYGEADRAVKHAFVSNFAREHKIRTMWDLGGNSGEFSVTAIESGVSHAVVMDSDLDALEAAYDRARNEVPEMHPVVMSCNDPSPAMGWNQAERAGLCERATADAILALALVHHLAIGCNIPLGEIAAWMVGLAPRGIVEFVPKDDPMVVEMTRLREDIFHDYDENNFLSMLSRNARIIATQRLETGRRLLIAFERNA
jgi:ribosomal protein L11 methylase PrmA